jgi:hypothetical protein
MSFLSLDASEHPNSSLRRTYNILTVAYVASVSLSREVWSKTGSLAISCPSRRFSVGIKFPTMALVLIILQPQPKTSRRKKEAL